MSQHGCPERLSNRSKGFPEEGSQPTMEVLVETLTGTAFEMTVSPSDTIFAIKSKICRVEGIPVSQQHLVYNLRELEDGMSLRALGICDGARLRLVLGMRGGPISSRRLPPPPEPWRDIERLLDSNRDDGDWGCASSGCRVTVVVFREGERVNMLRVRENPDGSYSPAEPHGSYSPPEPHGVYSPPEQKPRQKCNYYPTPSQENAAAGALTQNAVTMGKMLELRRRMESLSMRRHPPTGEKAEIQKTRSEETLSVPSLLEDPEVYTRNYTPYSEAEDSFPIFDGKYHRYGYGFECSFGDRYTLLPPINTRSDSDQSVEDVVAESERLKLSDTLGGGILVAGRTLGRADGRTDRDETAILEECVQPRHDQPAIAPNVPAPEYGPLVGGGSTWRGRGLFGSSSQLSNPPPRRHPIHHATPAHARSASSLHVRAAGSPGGAGAGSHCPAARAPPAPLSDALFSSSTSDLEQLRTHRLLPALSRHRNTEHLHLSDDHLHLATPAPAPPRAEIEKFLQEWYGSPHSDADQLHLATPAAPRAEIEVGSERRQRRIEKIAELENSRVFRFGDFEEVKKEELKSDKDEVVVEKEKKIRIRCGFCKKKLSIATVHVCRCGAEFCAPHRYAEVHGCHYDYKLAKPAHALQPLRAPKLPKI